MTIKQFREALKRRPSAWAAYKAAYAQSMVEQSRVNPFALSLRAECKAWFNQPRDAQGRFAKRA